MLTHIVDVAAVRRLRELRGLSAKQFAKAACISTEYVYKIEQGKKQPSAPAACRIAAALGVEITEILTAQPEDSTAPAASPLRESA